MTKTAYNLVMSRSLSDRRPTWIEWGLLGSGLATFSGLGLFFTKILPEEPGLLDGSDVAQAISAPAVWLSGLGLVLVGLSAGLATRAATGTSRGTYYMALANALAFALAMTVYFRLGGGG